jgi:hypothetical protein
MKKSTVLYLVAAAALYYWLLKRKKVDGTNLQSVDAAGKTARQLVSDIVDQTTFLPDETTFAKEYANDKKNCR